MNWPRKKRNKTTLFSKILNILMLVYNRKFIYCGLTSVKLPNSWSFVVKMNFPLKISLKFDLIFRDLGNKISFIIYCDVYVSIDAWKEDGTVGRLINDFKYFPNARLSKRLSAPIEDTICVFVQLESLISQNKFYIFMLRRTYHRMTRWVK